MSQPGNDIDFEAAMDGLQSDMRDHQVRFRGEVTAESNRALAAETVRQLERSIAEQKAAPEPTAPQPQPIQREVTHRTVENRSYIITKEADTNTGRPPTESEKWFLAHAGPRIELLLSKHDPGSWGDGFCPILVNPVSVGGKIIAGEIRSSNIPVSVLSWRERLLCAASWKDAHLAFPHMATAELCKVLEDSVHHFGDWKEDHSRITIEVP